MPCGRRYYATAPVRRCTSAMTAALRPGESTLPNLWTFANSLHGGGGFALLPRVAPPPRQEDDRKSRLRTVCSSACHGGTGTAHRVARELQPHLSPLYLPRWRSSQALDFYPSMGNCTATCIQCQLHSYRPEIDGTQERKRHR